MVPSHKIAINNQYNLTKIPGLHVLKSATNGKSFIDLLSRPTAMQTFRVLSTIAVRRSYLT